MRTRIISVSPNSVIKDNCQVERGLAVEVEMPPELIMRWMERIWEEGPGAQMQRCNDELSRSAGGGGSS